MNKPIDFYKTSNMAIEINEVICSACEAPFYELDGRELDRCPTCGWMYGDQELELNAADRDTYLLIVDPVTGVPAVVRRDGEPVLDKGYEVKPGDIVNVVNEIQFPFLKKVKVDHIAWHRGGKYAVLRFSDELYTIPLERVVLAPKEGADKHEPV